MAETTIPHTLNFCGPLVLHRLHEPYLREIIAGFFFGLALSLMTPSAAASISRPQNEERLDAQVCEEQLAAGGCGAIGAGLPSLIWGTPAGMFATILSNAF